MPGENAPDEVGGTVAGHFLWRRVFQNGWPGILRLRTRKEYLISRAAFSPAASIPNW
jgi:hypothetical protein